MSAPLPPVAPPFFAAEAGPVIVTGPSAALALAPDGSRLAVAANRGITMYEDTARQLWNTPARTVPPVAPARPGLVARPLVELVWPAEGRDLYLLAAGQITAVDTDTGANRPVPPQLAEHTDATVVAVSPSGWLVAVGTAGGQVVILDRRTATCKEISCVDPVKALAWQPGEQTLAVATNAAIQFWTTRTTAAKSPSSWLLSYVRSDLGSPVTGVAWPPGGAGADLLAVRAAGQVMLVHGRSGRPQAAMRAPQPGGLLAFTRDGRFLLAGSGNQLDVLDRQLIHAGQLPASATGTGDVSLCRDGLLAARRDGWSVTIWRLPDAVSRPAATDPGPAVRRWASAMSETVGRTTSAREGRYDATLAVPSTVAQPAGGRAAPAFAFTPRGGYVRQDAGGTLVVSGPAEGTGTQAQAGAAAWRVNVDATPGGVYELALSHNGHWLAAASVNTAGRVYVIDVEGRRVENTLTGGQSPVWSPDGLWLAVPEPGENPSEVKVYDRGGRRPPRRLRAGDGVRRLAASPDGRLLAGGSWGAVVLWETEGWTRQRVVPVGEPTGHQCLLAFSPDGRYLAVARGRPAGPVVVLDTETWTVFRSFGQLGAFGWSPSLAWSPDCRLLAFPSENTLGAVEVWDVAAGSQVAVLDPVAGEAAAVWTVAWSPDGSQIAVTQARGRTVLWRVGGASGAFVRTSPLPFGRDILSGLGAAASASGAGVPLSLLTDLLSFAVGGGPEELRQFTGRRGGAALRALGWNARAATGLAVLLAADLPVEQRWAAPPGAAQAAMEGSLRTALTGAPVPPEPPPVPAQEVAAALDRVDEPLLDLLAMLGPEAVAAEPTLPARLRSACPSLPPLSPRQRKLLDLRLTLTEEGGAQGRGRGEERAGLTRRGDLDQLLPTQLALPADVLAARLARDELLYRTRHGRPPVGPRPSIIVLDNTPAVHGVVGLTLRISAHLLAAALLGHHRPCALVTLGGPPWSRIISSTRDLLVIWTAGTLVPPDPDQAFALAESLADDMADPVSGAPRVMLLSHPFTAAPTRFPAHSLHVHYPGRPVTVTGRRCHLLAPDPEPEALAQALTSLLTEED